MHDIYELGLKHGMKLAAISGVNGAFSNEDIEHVRELALAARAKRPASRKKVRATRKVVAPKRVAPTATRRGTASVSR